MISTGPQIRAARALLGWTRAELASAACLHKNAVAYWERMAVISVRRQPYAVKRIREVLQAHGVVTFTEGGAGVCLKPTPQRRERTSPERAGPAKASPRQAGP